MQPTSASTPYSGPPSFAGLLADLAAPEQKFPPARDLDGLEDDVATLSYEQALRAHGRYRPAENIAPPAEPSQPAEPAAAQPSLFPQPAADPGSAGSRKSASITLRMSAAECDQLRSRAAEAGLTVSAYLRSCAFEVESLRAQVKETVAQLRAGATARRWWRPWRARG